MAVLDCADTLMPDHLPNTVMKLIMLTSFLDVSLQRRPYNEYSGSSSNSSSSSSGNSASPGAELAGSGGQQACLAPLGGILHVDLLSLSAPARQSHGWIVRQVSARPEQPTAGSAPCEGL
jgi:hypothetical protein